MSRGCDRFFTAAFLGLLVCGSLALAAAPFTPLHPWLFALPLALAALRPVRQEVSTCVPARGHIATLAAFAVVLAALESIVDPLYDSALYHTQLTSWMSTYGLPPGLGLLHYRLGFSSSWFALGALFDHGFLVHRMSRCVTGFALLLLLAQSAWAFARCFRSSDAQTSHETARNWFLVGAMPVLLVISNQLVLSASPSPNFGVAAATVFAAWLVVEGPTSLGFLVACAATAVKMSTGPMALVLFHRARPIVWVVAVALAAPIFWANYWTTGCPAFPASLCFESTHSLGGGEAKRIALETLNFARNASDFRTPYADNAWVGGWLRQWDNQVVFVPAALGLLVILVTRTWNRAVALALASTFYCLVSAPSPRFAFGSAAVLVGVAAVAGSRYQHFRVLVLLCSVLLVMNSAFIVWLRAPQLDPSSYWLLPSPAYLHGQSGKQLLHHGLPLNLPPRDDRCGALPLPCTPYPPDVDVGLCDPARGLSAGFCRWPFPR